VVATLSHLPDLSSTQVALGGAGIIAFVAYCIFIFMPAWGSYGRLWEKVAAGFLSLFILAALVGVGVGLGVAGLYIYLQNV
jgi:hypothetical protein